MQIFGQGRFLLFLFIFLFSLFIPSVFAQTSDNRVTLSLTPSSQDIGINQAFSVGVEIDSKENKVTAADLEIDFDPEFLTVESVDAGTYLPVILIPANTDNSAGRVRLTLGASVVSPATGVGKLATINFKSKKQTQLPTKIIINPSTAVTAIDQSGNQVGILNNSNVSISPLTILKTGSFALDSKNQAPKVGEEFPVILRASSSDEANLFSAHLNFDPDSLEVIKIDTSNSFIVDWASSTFDNEAGLIKLIGGVPNPGFKTSDLGSDMAVIYFKTKNSGTILLSFLDSSSIFRNIDNADILGTKTPLVLEVVPNPTPTPSASPISTPTPSSTPTPTPSPTPELSPCVITSAAWNTTGPVSEGKIVNLNINGSGNCNGKKIQLTVKEDDGVLGSQNVTSNPADATFNGLTAQTTWVAEYQTDGIFGVWGPPEYLFNAQLSDGSSSIKSGNRLTVTQLLIGQSSKGDGDYDGVINLKDLSVLFTHWNKHSNFPSSLDINDDGVINSFDFSSLINILKSKNIL